MNPNLDEAVGRLTEKAEALILRSSTHHHAQLLDAARHQNAGRAEITVSRFAVEVVIALLDEHEAMNRNLTDRLRTLLAALVEMRGENEALRDALRPFAEPSRRPAERRNAMTDKPALEATPATAGGGEREAIARLIDPGAWKMPGANDEWEWAEGQPEERQQAALATADAIIALFPAPSPETDEAAFEAWSHGRNAGVDLTQANQVISYVAERAFLAGCRSRPIPDEMAAEVGSERREDLKNAFVAGCCAVLTWTHSGMPQDDLDEAGYDYAADKIAKEAER